jgi:protein-tyrosine phosphatase
VIGVLFVCLGNICRSPLAEGVFRQVVIESGLADRFEIDSAGTSDYHIGSSPDPRTAAVARRRGVALEHAARQVGHEDLLRFRYVVVMDESNHGRVRSLAASIETDAEILLLRDFDPEANGERAVPDPYFGGPSGFEQVHDMVERACRGLLDHLRREHAL